MTEGGQERDLVIYLGAGAMAGIFGVGFMQALAASPVRHRVKAIYAVSAGALTGVYYLSEQLDELVQLYQEDMCSGDFMQLHLRRQYFLRVLSNRLLGTSYKLDPLFNNAVIDLAVSHERRVDFATLQSSGVPLQIVSYRLETGEHEYLEVTKEEDVVPIMKASTGGQPGYPEPTVFNGLEYLDGASITDRQTLQKIRSRHPNERILLVLSSTAKRAGRVRVLGVALGASILMWALFGFLEARRILWQEFQPDIFKNASREGFAVVESDSTLYRFTTDRAALQELLEHGRQKGEAWLKAFEA